LLKYSPAKVFIIYAVCMTSFLLFVFYSPFLKDNFVEVDYKQYVQAKDWYSEHPATKDMYCKSLGDNFLSNSEYFKMMNTKSDYEDSVDNTKAREAAEKIKAEGCE
jgi:hypothetical protein